METPCIKCEKIVVPHSARARNFTHCGERQRFISAEDKPVDMITIPKVKIENEEMKNKRASVKIEDVKLTDKPLKDAEKAEDRYFCGWEDCGKQTYDQDTCTACGRGLSAS